MIYSFRCVVGECANAIIAPARYSRRMPTVNAAVKRTTANYQRFLLWSCSVIHTNRLKSSLSEMGFTLVTLRRGRYTKLPFTTTTSRSDATTNTVAGARNIVNYGQCVNTKVQILTHNER